MKNIKVLANFLRYENGMSFDQRWLENVLSVPIEAALNVKVELLDKNDLEDMYYTFYNEFGIYDIQKESWIDVAAKEPTSAILNSIQKYFKDSLVIAFELHPVVQKAFDRLGIKYIKLMNHPVRYLDDIFFGITSNSETIHNKIYKYITPEFLFKQHASILKAQAAVSEFVKRFQIEENSCVFFAQTNIDCSLIDGDKLYTFFDFKDEFLKDIEPYNHVYFKIHPCEVSTEAVDFVKTIDKVSILRPNNVNFYDLISSENIKKCFAISSGSLYEARLFGKEVKYYYKQPFAFVTDYTDKNYKIEDTFIPIYKTFWQPAFWADVLSEYFTPRENIPVVNENYSNKLRRILKMTWGYVDSDSVYMYHHVNATKRIWGSLNKLKYKYRNFFVRLLGIFIPLKAQRKKFRDKYLKK